MYFLYTKQEIESALRIGPVFAKVPDLDPAKQFIVRDVKEEKDNSTGKKELFVKLLEGWRKPSQVFTLEEKRERAA